MKKILSFMFLAIVVCTTAMAQDTLYIRQADGRLIGFPKTSVDYHGRTEDAIFVRLATPVNEIEKVTFTLDDNGPNPISDDYFEVDGGNTRYHDGDMPQGGDTTPDVEANNEALPGGTSIIGVGLDERIEVFYIAIEGVAGFFEIFPEEPVYSLDQYIYKITLIFSQNFDHDILLHIGGRTVSGKNLAITDHWIRFHKAETGDLQISLSFSNAKDIDLHVYTPTGQHYYYGNKGGYYTKTDGTQVRYGLDVDSNAGCNIDNINCENISFPEELLENGTYEVRVNMYDNCNRSIATNWSLVAKRGGHLITNQLVGYGNPANGTYPVAANNGDHTVVMRFNVETSHQAPGLRYAPVRNIQPIPLTDMDIMKIMQEKSE